MQVELRRRTVGEQVALLFRLVLAHLRPLFVISLVTQVPVLVGQWFVEHAPQARGEVPAQALAVLALMIGSAFVLTPVQIGASVLCLAESFTGERRTLRECFALALRELWPLLVLGFLSGLLIGIGMMLCLVPGVIFWLWFYVAGPALVLEHLGGTAALGRSRALTEGFRLELLGFVLLTVLVQVAVAAGGSMLATIVGASVAAFSPGLATPTVLLLNLLFATVAAMLYPVAPVVAYFNLRVVKEGFDVEALAAIVDRIGTQAEGSAAP